MSVPSLTKVREKLKTGFEHLQDLPHFLHAGLAELFAGDDVDRRGGFRGGAAAGARTEHLHGVEFRGCFRRLFLVGGGRPRACFLRLRRQCERQAQGQRRHFHESFTRFHRHAWVTPARVVGALRAGGALMRHTDCVTAS